MPHLGEKVRPKCSWADLVRYTKHLKHAAIELKTGSILNKTAAASPIFPNCPASWSMAIRETKPLRKPKPLPYASWLTKSRRKAPWTSTSTSPSRE